jgi:hypothetical protein
VPILNEADLQMDVEVVDGRLERYPMLLAMSNYFGDRNLSKVVFDTLRNTFQLRTGVMEIPAMTINSSLGFIEISGRQALDKVGRHLFGSALGTGRANSGLATEGDAELNVASAAREASNAQIWVTTQEETPESLFNIGLQRPVSVGEPAIIGGDKWLQVVHEDSPEGAEECIALAIVTPASRRRRGGGGESKGHQTSGISREWSRSPAGSFRARITSRCHSRKVSPLTLSGRRRRSRPWRPSRATSMAT